MFVFKSCSNRKARPFRHCAQAPPPPRPSSLLHKPALMPVPDHPPYALMIATAIRALAEDGGSTEAAISTFIRANYDGLPWGHDRLLPYCLRKFTEMGEFIVATPARYKTAFNDHASPPPPKATVAAADVAENSQIVPFSSTSKRRRGRPRKVKNIHDLIGASPPLPLAAIKDGTSSSRRRGRPPKRKLADTNLAEDDGGENIGDSGQHHTVPLFANGIPLPVESRLPEASNADQLEYVLALPCPELVRAFDTEKMKKSSNGDAVDEAEPEKPLTDEDKGSAAPKRRGRGRPRINRKAGEEMT